MFESHFELLHICLVQILAGMLEMKTEFWKSVGKCYLTLEAMQVNILRLEAHWQWKVVLLLFLRLLVPTWELAWSGCSGRTCSRWGIFPTNKRWKPNSWLNGNVALQVSRSISAFLLILLPPNPPSILILTLCFSLRFPTTGETVPISQSLLALGFPFNTVLCNSSQNFPLPLWDPSNGELLIGYAHSECGKLNHNCQFACSSIHDRVFVFFLI